MIGCYVKGLLIKCSLGIGGEMGGAMTTAVVFLLLLLMFSALGFMFSNLH